MHLSNFASIQTGLYLGEAKGSFQPQMCVANHSHIVICKAKPLGLMIALHGWKAMFHRELTTPPNTAGDFFQGVLINEIS